MQPQPILPQLLLFHPPNGSPLQVSKLPAGYGLSSSVSSFAGLCRLRSPSVVGAPARFPHVGVAVGGSTPRDVTAVPKPAEEKQAEAEALCWASI